MIASQLLRRLGRSFVLLVVLCAVAYWLNGYTAHTREELAVVQSQAQERPEYVSAQARLQNELEQTKPAVSMLESFVLQPDTINVLVKRLQDEGKRQAVEVQVSDIQPVKETSAAGGSFTLVQLRVVAQGSPNHLLRFFQSVEHLPFLLQVQSWIMNNQATTALSGTASVGNAPAADLEASPTPTPEFAPSQLELMILLSVANTSS